MADCICGTPGNNTGIGTCNPIERVVAKRFLMHLYDGAGNKNYLDLTAMTQDDILALINHPDPLKRLYPLPKIENVEPTKGDSSIKEYNSGTSVFLDEGIKSNSEIIVAPTRTFLGKIKSWRGCTDFGEFAVDRSNNIYGIPSSDGTKLYPRPVNEQSWNPVWSDAKDADPQEILLTFSYPKTDREENVNVVLSSETDNFDWINADGLIDVNCAFSSPTTTGIVMTLTTDYGSVGSKIPVTGLLVTDFGDESNPGKFYNDTTMGWVAITTAVESSTIPGQYTLTFAAQTANDEARFPITKNGLDDARFENTLNTLL